MTDVYIELRLIKLPLVIVMYMYSI